MTENSTNNTIEQLEKDIKKAETLAIRGEERLKNLKSQYQETIKQLKDLDIDPEKAEESLNQMEKELKTQMEEIQKLVPDNLNDFEIMLNNITNDNSETPF